jgi:lipopolysaccharide transport system ATP-binding protein
MGNIAIKVENLGKLYRIGGPQERYQTFRDAITRAAVAPFKRARDLLRGQAYGAANLQQEIWALKDVSFEIKHGEVVGIIGRNGAGKSTLLKILSRITEPTTGYADIYGRVGALLEVGTGFHPELTGRENIYLNGAILGMSRNDIDRKFDEIVAFSGVEKFIDTPVKHYSSGMGLRLGFSVAAHLEPEILVVDEVLAVGDAEFQKKCLGKMSDVAGEGRTVLFVSHNMAAVQNLCTRSILLNSGSVILDSTTTIVINSYIGMHQQQKAEVILDSNNPLEPSIEKIVLSNLDSIATTFVTNQSFCFEVTCSLGEITPNRATLGFAVNDALGKTIFAGHSNQYGLQVEGKKVRFKGVITHLPLTPGTYSLSIYLSDGRTDYAVARDSLYFEIFWNQNTGLLYPPRDSWGSIFVPVSWSASEC